MSTFLVYCSPLGQLLLVLLASTLFFAAAATRDRARPGLRQLLLRAGAAFLLAWLGVPWGRALLPAWLSAVGVGYLLHDPKVRRLPGQPAPAGRWARFWWHLTGREKRADVWSAYLEMALLMANILYYLHLVNA